jgi:hypothetical protein
MLDHRISNRAAQAGSPCRARRPLRALARHLLLCLAFAVPTAGALSMPAATLVAQVSASHSLLADGPSLPCGGGIPIAC